MEKVTVKFAKCRPDAKIPTQVKGSVGLDMYACFDEPYMIIQAHKTKLIPTGMKMALPEGYFMWLEERGSTGSKGIKRSAGILDNSWRGDTFMAVTNSNDWDICIYKTDDENVNKMYNEMMDAAEKEDADWAKSFNSSTVDTYSQDIVEKRFDKDWKPQNTEEMVFYPYDKAVFQGIVLPQYEVESEEISEAELDSMTTVRGAGMLGSSGK